ncbi:hypothetical protein EGJ29_09645 [Pseudomonas sp. s199]|nr:hypothetical protein EGJ29_09645 [Pseudomonas sp. s199]
MAAQFFLLAKNGALDGIALTTQRCITAFTADARIGLFFFAVAFAIAVTAATRAIAIPLTVAASIATAATTSAAPATVAVAVIIVTGFGWISRFFWVGRISRVGRIGWFVRRAKGAVVGISLRTLISVVRWRRVIGIGSAARIARGVVIIAGTLKAVTPILIRAKHARRRTAGVNVNVVNNVLKGISTGISADRSGRLNTIRTMNGIFQLMLVIDDGANSRLTRVRLRIRDTPIYSVVVSAISTSIALPTNIGRAK